MKRAEEIENQLLEECLKADGSWPDRVRDMARAAAARIANCEAMAEQVCDIARRDAWRKEQRMLSMDHQIEEAKKRLASAMESFKDKIDRVFDAHYETGFDEYDWRRERQKRIKQEALRSIEKIAAARGIDIETTALPEAPRYFYTDETHAIIAHDPQERMKIAREMGLDNASDDSAWREILQADRIIGVRVLGGGDMVWAPLITWLEKPGTGYLGTIDPINGEQHV